jgi:uncharacterized FlaG/YvyC family protein
MGMEIPGILKTSGVPETVLKDQLPSAERPPARAQPAPAPATDQIEAHLRALEKTFSAFNHRIKLFVNEEIDQVVIKVVDASTDTVIKEIPAEEIQHLIARIKEAIGLLVDEKI